MTKTVSLTFVVLLFSSSYLPRRVAACDATRKSKARKKGLNSIFRFSQETRCFAVKRGSATKLKFDQLEVFKISLCLRNKGY